MSSVSSAKIGLTTSPAWRFYECSGHSEDGQSWRSHWQAGFKAMHILTMNSGDAIARQEVEAIARINKSELKHKLCNIRRGGDGPIKQSSRTFVYLMTN